MKLLNRVLPGFICMLLIFALFPVCACADADIIEEGYFGNGLTWKIAYELKETQEEEFTLIISGSGAMPDLTGPKDAPWAKAVELYAYSIDRIMIEDGITAIGNYYFAYCDRLISVSLPLSLERIGVWAFGGSSLSSLIIPLGCVSIGGGAFEGCTSLTSIIIPDACTEIGDYAFAGCTALRSVTFEGSAPFIGENSFHGVTAAAWCSCLKEGWDEYTMLQYGAEQLIWDKHIYEDIVIREPTCIEDGVERRTCDLCGISDDVAIPALGHTVVIDPAVEPGFETDGLSEGSHCSVCGEVIIAQEIIPKTGYTVDLSAIPEDKTVEIDGVICDRSKQIIIDCRKPTFAVVFEYGESKGADQVKQYPSSMKVYRLSINEVDHTCTAEALAMLDNLLLYSGFSIRITGVSGIRVITAVRESLKQYLIETGIEGYKLTEYGTLVKWKSELAGSALTFNTSGVKHAAAYEKGKNDPVFTRSGGYVQYTNVITKVPDAQCGQDIAMRPYMILQNSEGEQIVFYGGTVCRSIGFIALQNKDVYPPGSNAYEYIWKLIRAAYGNAYSGSYKRG